MGVELVYFADASDAFPDQRPGSIGPVGPENFPSHISRLVNGGFVPLFKQICIVDYENPKDQICCCAMC